RHVKGVLNKAWCASVAGGGARRTVAGYVQHRLLSGGPGNEKDERKYGREFHNTLLKIGGDSSVQRRHSVVFHTRTRTILAAGLGPSLARTWGSRKIVVGPK